MIYLVLLVWDIGPQRDNAVISLFHSTLDFEGAVGGALGLCPRDVSCGGLEMCPRAGTHNLASFIYEWAGGYFIRVRK